MGSFGDKLKREREMRGVTLDEIADSTKIARRHLEALESEDFGSLPGGVFNKGFVRAYARFIGIDEDQAVADYAAVNQEVLPPEDQFPLEIHEKPNRELNPRSLRYLPLIGSAVALVLVVAGYAMYRTRHHQGDGVSVAAQTEQGTQEAKNDRDRIAQPARSAEPAKQEGRMVAVTENVAQPADERQVASAAPSSRPSEPAKPKALPPEHSFFVIIKAKEDAWISVVADGHRVSHGILKADKQRFVRAGKEILLTTGNAGGIDVSFNGRPLGAIGNESEARTLLFTPTGAAQQ